MGGRCGRLGLLRRGCRMRWRGRLHLLRRRRWRWRLRLLCRRCRMSRRCGRLDLFRGRRRGRLSLLCGRCGVFLWLHLLRWRSRLRRLGLLGGRRGLGRSRWLDLLCRWRFRTRGRRLALLRRTTSGLPGSTFGTAALGAVGFFRWLLLLSEKGHARLEWRGETKRREQSDGNDRAGKKQSPVLVLLSHGHPQSAGWRNGQNGHRGLGERR